MVQREEKDRVTQPYSQLKAPLSIYTAARRRTVIESGTRSQDDETIIRDHPECGLSDDENARRADTRIFLCCCTESAAQQNNNVAIRYQKEH